MGITNSGEVYDSSKRASAGKAQEVTVVLVLSGVD